MRQHFEWLISFNDYYLDFLAGRKLMDFGGRGFERGFQGGRGFDGDGSSAAAAAAAAASGGGFCMCPKPRIQQSACNALET